jgi:hypothetical protein
MVSSNKLVVGQAGRTPVLGNHADLELPVDHAALDQR